jgi:hypothetical protein
MDSPERIVNKVAESSLINIDLEEFYPKEEKAVFDLKDYLFKGLVLKEKDFREALKQLDWSHYKGKNVAVTCTADAIVPMWAYMLVGVYLSQVANHYIFGNEKELDDFLFNSAINKIDIEQYRDQRIIIKGCSDKPVPTSAFVEIIRRLTPVAKSLMYGEACSNVPLFKKNKVVENH